ncbi:hypothetical protein [Seonamhaeicola marinus]|uniref:Uncharacterized protein n=1 Tax=Seonamhaeicola marinus TaxID=1912246 RepID=A0A5D0I4G8_9FLAO|nr:hypothetical protein [Seonamhaeicola marinus]TYA78633.1 hypothetical protein FUA24_09785 [Seonamhaeicola marinus]
MKLYYYCSSQSCKKENSITIKSNNRYDLKQEIGLEINERCKHCGNHTKRHINRLHAKPNYIIIIAGWVLAAIVTVFLWNLGWISTLTATIPIAIWMSEEKRASAFNKVLLRD